MEVPCRKALVKSFFCLGPRLSLAAVFLTLSIPVLGAESVLRGQVRIELEPVRFTQLEDVYIPDADTVRIQALEEAALHFSAIIYGWHFDYEIGERARSIPELFELNPLGRIEFGDPRMRVSDVSIDDMVFSLWCEYRPDEVQLRHLAAWDAGRNRTIQAYGTGSMYTTADPEFWVAGKQAALEDAARAAVRSLLQGTERNRPKESRGRIALVSFPRYFFDAGRWAVSARFMIEITEIVPFAAY